MALRRHLLCLWTQTVTGTGDPYPHRVLPDGCIDIVFRNDEPPRVIGPYVDCYVAKLPPGTTIVGARFHPGRAAGVLGHPASTLLNLSAPLDAVWNNSACSRLRSTPDRRAALEMALAGRIAQPPPLDRAVIAAIEWLARHPEGRVEQLCSWMGMSSRQLRRRFSAEVGYPPKMFQEVLRFQSLLHLATGTEQLRLADLSAAAGYADQAHMTREVQRFSALPPTHLPGSTGCTLCLSGLVQRT